MVAMIGESSESCASFADPPGEPEPFVEVKARNTYSTFLSNPARISPPDAEESNDAEDSSGPSHVGSHIKDEATPRPSNQLKSTLLGLQKDRTSGKEDSTEMQNIPGAYSTSDYEKKYPPDRRHEELSDNARVWWMYNDEAAVFDADMVGEAADSLDILLVFAGLYSGVLTTFVAQTSQSLGPDNAAITVALLIEIASVQRAMATGASVDSIASADIAPPVARTDVWVNALWFTSLALSLSTALCAVLSKQWLRQYTSFISGSARDRALIRQFRYDGMEKWAVRTIIGLLPTILHLSLGLFLIGLVVFLAPLQRGVAIAVGIISGVLLALYLLSLIIAVVSVQSPYRSTFSDILSTILRWVVSFFRDVRPNARLAERDAAISSGKNGMQTVASHACNALLWVSVTTSSSSARSLVFQSLGAFPAHFLHSDTVKGSGTSWLDEFNSKLPDIFRQSYPNTRAAQDISDPASRHRLERHLRSLCQTGGDVSRNVRRFLDITDPELLVMAKFQHRADDSVDASTQSFWVDNLRSCGFHLEFAEFMVTQCRLLARPSYDRPPYPMESPAEITVIRLPWFSAATWTGIIRGRRLFRLLSPRDVPNWQTRGYGIDKEMYMDIVCMAGQLMETYWNPDDETYLLDRPISFCHFMGPIFLRLGWYTRGCCNTIQYHPVLKNHPHVESSECVHSASYDTDGCWSKVRESRMWRGITAALRCTGEPEDDEDDAEMTSMESSSSISASGGGNGSGSSSSSSSSSSRISGGGSSRRISGSGSVV